METLRLLWRLVRFFTLELPILLIAVVFGLTLIRDFDLERTLELLTWFGAGLGAFALLGLIWLLRPRAPNAYGTAHFADRKALRKAGLHGKGMIIGKKAGRFIRFSQPGHLLTFAPTRSGKGVSAVIPNLLDHPGSVVVTDIKGENHRITGAYRNRLGPVLALAPLNPEVGNATINPLDFIRTGTDYEVDDARLLAEMIVATDGPEPNHWEREARTLITGLLLYIVNALPAERRNLAELRNLLMCNRAVFDAHLDNMSECASSVAARIADGFTQKEDRERASVISTAQGATAVFESPHLIRTTATSSFRFEQLKDGTLSLFIIVPPEYVKAYQPFLRLVVGLATAAMTRNVTMPAHPVLFLLDELPALGYMRPIEDGIGYLAGYGASLWLFVQDLDQLKQTYRKWRSMIANCAVRQAFNVQDTETAQLISGMLGQRTVKVRSEGHTGRFGRLGLPSTFSASRTEAPRPLLSADEVMLLPGDKALVFVQGCRPILAEKVRYYAERLFKGRWRPARRKNEHSQLDLTRQLRLAEK
ncbi:MAG: type IV secretory system conjugative DNA transfer family protein [Alphaproteobacteria bacterium]|nr:type IV secretory system conjugative DNA transfer family protein [Alphaproteobacteria bacterium]